MLNGRHAADSSACSSPRQNRNDWFPAEAEAQGAHSHLCERLTRHLGDLWTLHVISCWDKHIVLGVEAILGLRHYGSIPLILKGRTLVAIGPSACGSSPWSMHSENNSFTLKYPALTVLRNKSHAASASAILKAFEPS